MKQTSLVHLAKNFELGTPLAFIQATKSSLSTLASARNVANSIDTTQFLQPPLDLSQANCTKSLRFVPVRELETVYKTAFKEHATKMSIVNNLLNIEFSAVIGYQLMLLNYLQSDRMPDEFYWEGIQIILDEIRHFEMLSEYFADHGFEFGQLPVNNNILTDLSNCKSFMDHIALVSLTHEGKGIDAGPRLIRRLKGSLDRRLEAIVAQIVAEEEGHVGFGVRWFKHKCQKHGVDPKTYYKDFLERNHFKVFEPNVAVRNRIQFDFVDYSA